VQRLISMFGIGLLLSDAPSYIISRTGIVAGIYAKIPGPCSIIGSDEKRLLANIID
jgi:hypothetical protein